MPDDIADATGVEDVANFSFEDTSEADTLAALTGEVEEVEVPAVSGDTYKVTVGGEEIEVSLDEALAGYQRQSDYTRKTQELASQREELSYAERLAQQLETNPQGTLAALAAAYEVDLGAQRAPVVEEVLDPEDQRYAALTARIEAQEQREFEAQLQSQLTTLHSQFGEFDNVELLQFAVERNIPNLEDAAKVFTYDGTIGKALAERRATAAKAALPPVQGGRAVAAGAVVQGAAAPGEKLTLEQSLASAIASHRS